MKKTLACLAVLAALSVETPAATLNLDPAYANKRWAEMIVDSMTLDGMDVSLVFWRCGQVNAFYYPALKTVVVCGELLEELNFSQVRFVVAHEMAHAIIMQRDLPFTGSHEDAADELAAVYLYSQDLRDDIFAAAEWFWDYRQYKGGPFDDHTDPEKRAYKLLCYWDGSRGADSEIDVCYDRFSRALRAWDRLLKL